MKKVLLALSLTLTYSMGLSQISMPTDSATWTVTYQTIHCSNPSTVLQYLWRGDTLIGGNSYEKIEKVYGSGDPSCHYTNFPSKYNFYRQIGSKVYAYDVINTVDTLLYDFSLNVGDTVSSALAANSCPVYVTSIDSILLQDGYHKRLFLGSSGCSFGGYMIEGLGSSFGLFEEMITFESYSDLNCFSTNQGVSYPAPVSGCPIVTGIQEAIVTSSGLTLLSNNGEIYLENVPYGNYRFYSLDGKLVCQGAFQNNKIYLDESLSGIYFGMISAAEADLTVKVISIH